MCMSLPGQVAWWEKHISLPSADPDNNEPKREYPSHWLDWWRQSCSLYTSDYKRTIHISWSFLLVFFWLLWLGHLFSKYSPEVVEWCSSWLWPLEVTKNKTFSGVLYFSLLRQTCRRGWFCVFHFDIIYLYFILHFFCFVWLYIFISFFHCLCFLNLGKTTVYWRSLLILYTQHLSIK